MYIYTIQAMPGSRAKFEGDTSVKYRVRRAHTSPSAKDKRLTAFIRTDLDHAEASAMVAKFNDKEREAHAVKKDADASFAGNS